MKKIFENLDKTYKLISSLSVSGDAVDVVAVVRANLRNIHEELSKAPIAPAKETEKENDADG